MITAVRKIDTYGGYEITPEQSKLVHETLHVDPVHASASIILFIS
jgi:hypothetical protein